MNTLASHWLGLELASPIVASASPLTANLDNALALEDAGAGAIVMRSLFEEHCQQDNALLDTLLYGQDIGHFEADDYLPPVAAKPIKTTEQRYLETLQTLKSRLAIPVIASLNGVSPEGWEEHASAIEQAGADGLELNIYYVAANLNESAEQVEQRYVDIVRRVCRSVRLPVAVKIGAQFSSPVHMVEKLKMAGASGVVLFNRFYQPDINLATLDVDSHIQLSTSAELLERLRWIAIIRHQVALELAVTGGVHSHYDVIKASLAGASIAQVCSVLLQQGSGVIATLNQQIRDWLAANEYDSLQQLRGSVSYRHSRDPAAYERANYLDLLDNWHP